MTSKAAWFRIISDYHRNLREGGEKRFVYEEMIVAANEMKQGITEAEAYDHFGHRCGTSQYLKFLLDFNTKRQNRSRRYGKDAGGSR